MILLSIWVNGYNPKAFIKFYMMRDGQVVPFFSYNDIFLCFCSHAIILEREWNPANEEQAEGRFSRIGSEASSILVNYPNELR